MKNSLALRFPSLKIAEIPRPRIAIIIPAYNEEHSIEGVLQEIAILRQAHVEWNVLSIVVNDGSSDQTAWVLDQIASKYQIRVIHLPVNLGIGGAVQAGFRMASQWGADVALQLDGDGQHPPQEIPKLIQPILDKKSDVVVGSRYVNGAGGNVSNWIRQLGTSFFSRLIQILVGVRIRDTTSGFRAFSADATEFISRYYPDDYPEVEAYVPLVRKNFQIQEVPVQMRIRKKGSSSITPLRSAYYMLKVAFATAIDVIRLLPPRRKREGRKE